MREREWGAMQRAPSQLAAGTTKAVAAVAAMPFEGDCARSNSSIVIRIITQQWPIWKLLEELR